MYRNGAPGNSAASGKLSRAVAIAAILLATLPASALAATQISSARVWPAQEYTRLTLESDAPISYNVFTVGTPARLVLDLEDVEFNGTLEQLPAKISPADPYVSGVRIGRFKPGVVRLVLDLKAQVKPQVFVLKPVGEYGHRLVLDVYPLLESDPLMALLDKKQAPASVTPPAENTQMTDKPATGFSGSPAAAPAAPSRKAAPPADVARLITVAIDAGHGGEDPGARGRSGTHEKHVTLAIARKLKALVDDEPNMRGVLIREGDYFIPLVNRVIKARKVQADLFVSIHADAYVKPHARGSSVFALSERGATSAAAGWLARKENEADQIGGVNIGSVADPVVASVVYDLAQTATMNDSMKLAKAVLGAIGGVNDLHKSHVEQAGFAVLKAPDIPSILVETAFLTNPEEEKKLKDENYQDKMAQAILVGIRKYFSANPPLARSKLAQN
jgi:N-acetylmuramoyl-L-alanine amidase